MDAILGGGRRGDLGGGTGAEVLLLGFNGGRSFTVVLGGVGIASAPV